MQTDWEEVTKWYDQAVGKEGHYFHKQVIFPRLLPLLALDTTPEPSLLDLACGQGVLAHYLPDHIPYTGIDLSASLIAAAKKKRAPHQTFLVGDICQPLPLKKRDFSHATCLLALQNIASPAQVLGQAALHLRERGLLALVLNHPCFRIPRQTHWGEDSHQKLLYRRIDRYLSPLQIPIHMQPGKGEASTTTWSFHYSLSDLSRFLADAGFVIHLIEEWTSDKKSSGPKAKMENRARQEFPLFLTLLAQKI